ncbi:hypothetical protein KOI35_15505 [Actinoplanes bogorensis]|uniref:Exo-alpha-sialidase n=1 Tax=Paractinoplanes bogorensis TaxID=1610840 RepID=A0ABS5YQB2_9ACTN|nr:hypothetical protein [Actinoplanes bogorensis]MBU2664908.1 hypothetical protein [Actinoplanes bogorensis]
MPETQFERLRSDVGEAVRQPDFLSVRLRAARVRRRRAATTAAIFLVTVLSLTGLGYAVQRDHRGAATFPGGPTAETPWPRMTSVVATGKDLYGVLVRCPDCASELYATSDGGDSWQLRTVPPEPADADTPRSVSLVALAPGILGWRDARVIPIHEAISTEPTADRLWITTNGGGSWQKAVVDRKPVAAVPAGTSAVGCELPAISTCAVAAVDPATGTLAPLAAQPKGIVVDPSWPGQVNVPAGGRLWVPGLDPVTKKPAIATSADAGRTWRTHVFADGVAAVYQGGTTGMMYVPRVAAGPGPTAYALTYRADDAVDARYTTDGGVTWRTGETLREGTAIDSYVTAYGEHVVTTGTAAVSADGTGPYTAVSLAGYPAEPVELTRITTAAATERYLVKSQIGPYVSHDGRTWRRVPLP